MRIGYLFRGYLGDIKYNSKFEEVSSPDGNATYSWCVEWAVNKRKYVLIPLGENLDHPAAMTFGENLFSAFSKDRRSRSYIRMFENGWKNMSNRLFPEVDILLIEWRWPIKGRNTPDCANNEDFQNDLVRQQEVLEVYSSRKTPIIIWDLDHKITYNDEIYLKKLQTKISIIETSVIPRKILFDRVSVYPPVVVNDLLQFDINYEKPIYNLGYIGSRYERDETIDKWILPIAPKNTKRVLFRGKWEPKEYVADRWPGIVFGDRIPAKEFYENYSKCAMVPLFAKKSYYECGFMTPRPAEAIIFGSIPIGLSEHIGVHNYCNYIANCPEELLQQSKYIKNISPIRRKIIREEAAHKLSCMNVDNFIDSMEKLC